jgi:methyl-accepting chemotaxis protein
MTEWQMNSKPSAASTGSGGDSAAVMARLAEGVASVTHSVPVGEYGTGFAVAANEIKDLEERTAGSTEENHDIIHGLQEVGQDAVKLIVAGAERMDKGVRRFQQAHDVLKKIFASSEETPQRIRQVEQASLLDRELARFNLRHTDHREPEGMG